MMMFSFYQAPLWLRGGIGVWFLVTLFAGLGLLVPEVRRQTRLRFGMLPIVVITYLSFQCITYINDEDFVLQETNPAAAGFARLPVPALLAFLILISLLEARSYLLYMKWKQTHLSNASIKDAVDSLPAGICCYEDNGHILLKNTTMEEICRKFTDAPLLNGREFAKRLNERMFYLEDRSVILCGERAYALEEIQVDGTEAQQKELAYRILTASDITEEYQKILELSDRRNDVLLLNEKLRAYNKEITSIITQKEILRAKIQVHDVMGSALLSAKRYITGGASEALQEEILRDLTGGVDYLLTESDSKAKDPYRQIFETAEQLEVKILVNGNLPQGPVRKKILATAMHECLTNTLRHAGGDTLYVKVEEDGKGLLRVIFTNNGVQPAGPIAEKGGLVSLRRLTEEAGGQMEVGIADGFYLTLILPEEDRKNGL